MIGNPIVEITVSTLTEIGEKTREAPAELLDNPEIKKALTALEESAFSEVQLYSYEKFWDIISVEKNLYNSAERRGLAAGKAEGLVEGKAMQKQEIALSMKRSGIDICMIAQCTGLTVNEIDAL